MAYPKMQQATGIILAGGKGSRINKNKALITLPGGKTLIQRCVESVGKVCGEILIVGGQQELIGNLDVHVVEDLIKGKGPLGGILTGLCYSTSHCNFVMACDMPFPQPNLIKLLLGECNHYDVVVPQCRGEVEPLFAVYSKNCLPVVLDQIQKDDLKIRRIFRRLRVRKVGEEGIDQVDPKHLSFFNINREQDLRNAQELLSSITNEG